MLRVDARPVAAGADPVSVEDGACSVAPNVQRGSEGSRRAAGGAFPGSGAVAPAADESLTASGNPVLAGQEPDTGRDPSKVAVARLETASGGVIARANQPVSLSRYHVTASADE